MDHLSILLARQYVQDAVAIGKNILCQLQFFSITDVFHLKFEVTNGLVDNHPVKPGERHFDGEVGACASPFLTIVDLLDMLEHIGLEVLLILVQSQINGMLHVGLIALIQPNEPVSDTFRRQVERVEVVVWRVYFYSVCV